jgi:hypothetical protein
MGNGASLSSCVLFRKLAGTLLVEVSLAHGVTAIAAVAVEITLAGAARYQVVVVIALVAQVAIRAGAH